MGLVGGRVGLVGGDENVVEGRVGLAVVLTVPVVMVEGRVGLVGGVEAIEKTHASELNLHWIILSVTDLE